MSTNVPSARKARAIWRDAVFAVVKKRGLDGVPTRVREWFLSFETVAEQTFRAPPPRTTAPGRVYSQTPNAISKRKSRARPDVRQREYDAAMLRRRQQGQLPREERVALDRAAREATRAEREASRKAKTESPEARAECRERSRQRRAAMTLEERRAEWNRHQRAKRARDAQRRRQEAA